MNRRAAKKRAKLWIDWFTREKIPAAFNTEQRRREYCAAWARSAEPLLRQGPPKICLRRFPAMPARYFAAGAQKKW